MNISITTVLNGLEIPFIYEINSHEQGIELMQEALNQGAMITEVVIN
jgi:hypothetical protein